MNIRLREKYPTRYIGSNAFIVLDCDCHHISGGGTRSGVHDDNPVYQITWPQHPEYHEKYITVMPDRFQVID